MNDPLKIPVFLVLAWFIFCHSFFLLHCRIENNEFLEYEEVYKDRYYGTLKAQVEKQLEAGQNVVFDVDVVGGCNINNSSCTFLSLILRLKTL